MTKNDDVIKFSVFQAAKWYYPAVGGIETVARELTGALIGRAKTEILACSEDKHCHADVADGVKVYRARTLCKCCSTPISLEYLFKFRKMSRKADIIQIHAPYPLSDLALLLSGGCKGSKVAVWWHSDVVKQKKMMLFYKPLMKYMLKRADVIFVAGKTIADNSAYLSEYIDKVKVLPFGIDPAEYLISPESGYLSNMLCDRERVKLLFVGRLVYYKGADVLIEAMRSVYGAELFIIGDGELEGELKKKASDDGLSDKIHFLGRVGCAQLREALCDCDVFVLPSVSRSECFGLVQLEAMVYGKPVVNTKLPTAVPEVSIDGETGITVTPGDPEELAKALNTLVSSPELREKYGKNARTRCIEHFSLERMQDVYYETIASLYK